MGVLKKCKPFNVGCYGNLNGNQCSCFFELDVLLCNNHMCEYIIQYMYTFFQMCCLTHSWWVFTSLGSRRFVFPWQKWHRNKLRCYPQQLDSSYASFHFLQHGRENFVKKIPQYLHRNFLHPYLLRRNPPEPDLTIWTGTFCANTFCTKTFRNLYLHRNLPCQYLLQRNLPEPHLVPSGIWPWYLHRNLLHWNFPELTHRNPPEPDLGSAPKPSGT